MGAEGFVAASAVVVRDVDSRRPTDATCDGKDDAIIVRRGGMTVRAVPEVSRFGSAETARGSGRYMEQ